MQKLRRLTAAFANDVDGGALVEYSLLIALIATICIIVVATLGNKVSKMYAELNQLFT